MALRVAQDSGNPKTPAKKQVTLAESFSHSIPYEKKGPWWKDITDAVAFHNAKDMVPVYIQLKSLGSSTC